MSSASNTLRRTEHLIIEATLTKPYQWVFIPAEEGGYTGLIREFPGCVSQGDTIDEAMERLREAATNWLSASLEARIGSGPNYSLS
jgi:predicted RNase H-like HicB family nuclease